jgi:DNA repair protein RadC
MWRLPNARQCRSDDLHQRPVVGSWDKLIDYCNAQIAYSKVEEFHILFLDRKNALIKDERQQRGMIDHTPVYTREVIKRALELGSSALIFVHNHPSGDPAPSISDISVTTDIIKVAGSLGQCEPGSISAAASLKRKQNRGAALNR